VGQIPGAEVFKRLLATVTVKPKKRAVGIEVKTSAGQILITGARGPEKLKLALDVSLGASDDGVMRH
jgi:hypothetical protein